MFDAEICCFSAKASQACFSGTFSLNSFSLTTRVVAFYSHKAFLRTHRAVPFKKDGLSCELAQRLLIVISTEAKTGRINSTLTVETTLLTVFVQPLFDRFVKSRNMHNLVIPVKTGI